MLKTAGVITFTILIVAFLVFVKIQNPADNLKDIAMTPIPTLSERNSLRIRGSIPYWDQENAFESFQNHFEIFDDLALFWYYITGDGKIQKYQYAKEDGQIIQFAHDNNVKVMAVITNLPEDPSSTWDSNRVEVMLQDPNKRDEHIKDIDFLLKRLSIDGISIDYENIVPTQKENFSLFIKKLATVVHADNKKLGVAIHPKTGKPADRRYDFQDWGEIAKYADELYIMAYSEHENESPPGPIASIPWVERIIWNIKKQNLPLSKIFLGIPVYGYDWNVTDKSKARDLTFNDVNTLLSQYKITEIWDPSANAPCFRYKENGQNHEVWYEDSKSIAAKINLAKENNLGGVTFWRLGEEDPGIWQNIIK